MGGCSALAIIMIPLLTRTTKEMVSLATLVPGSRAGAYGNGTEAAGNSSLACGGDDQGSKIGYG